MRDDLRSDKNAPSSAAPALHALLVVVVAVQKWPLCVRALSLLPPFAYQADPILLIEGSKFASIIAQITVQHGTICGRFCDRSAR